MSSGAPRGISHFRDDAARARFLAAYDALLATWADPPTAHDVATTVGTTHVNSLPGGDRTPVVLLHPLAVSSASWSATAPALAAAGHPVHAVDTVTDAGRSVPTRRVRSATELSVWLGEVLDGLALPRAHLIGVSYGAVLAMNAARHAPDRVLSVTATDPPAAIARPPASFVLAMLRGALAARGRRPDDALYPLLRRLHNGALPPEPLLELSVASIRGFVVRQPFPRRFPDDALRTFPVPLLFLIGGATPIVDAAAAEARVRRLVPGADTELFAGAGHSLPLEHPDAVNRRIVEFLDRVDG